MLISRKDSVRRNDTLFNNNEWKLGYFCHNHAIMFRLNSLSPCRCIDIFKTLIINDNFLLAYRAHFLHWDGFQSSWPSRVNIGSGICRQGTSHRAQPITTTTTTTGSREVSRDPSTFWSAILGQLWCMVIACCLTAPSLWHSDERQLLQRTCSIIQSLHCARKWVDSLWPCDVRWRQRCWPSSKPMLTYCEFGHFKQTSVKFALNTNMFTQDDDFKNVVCKMSTILFRSRCVKRFWSLDVRHVICGVLHRTKDFVILCKMQFTGLVISETGGSNSTYELLNLRALKFLPVDKIQIHIFRCMGKIFYMELLTHTLKDIIFIQYWNVISSQI